MQPARVEISTVRPRNRAVDEADLLKERGIAESGEHSSVRARNERHQVSSALHAVIERQRQTIVWQCRDRRDAPRCSGHYGGRYSSGMIFFGVCLA